jgi:ribose transport system ATP-binding protein
VRRLAHELGVAVIFVTHLLGEVMAVADRISVLREGQVLWTRARSEVGIGELVAAISPDAVSLETRRSREVSQKGLARFHGFRSSYCGPFDLTINEGEILGIYGMLGSGRTDLLETIAGARRPWSGRLTLRDRELHFESTIQAMTAGVALVLPIVLRRRCFPVLTRSKI